MVQATTPTFILTLPNTVDLTLVDSLWFSLKQGSTIINKTGESLVIEGQTVSVYLTQAETMQFYSGMARLQLNLVYPDGSRACSNIVPVEVGENLIKEVLE